MVPWAALLLLLPRAAPGGGVVNNCTEADLRAAMSGGGLVTFACDGTITLSSTITNAVDTILDGNGHQITISGGDSNRIFCVNSGTTLSLVGLTVANGKRESGAGILNLGGTVHLTDVRFEGNVADASVGYDFTPRGNGGACFNQDGVINATNCMFSDNLALQPIGTDPKSFFTARGGAICNQSGQVNLYRCAFGLNRAYGGPCNQPGFPPAEGFGGAIYNGGALTADLCTFNGNSAIGGPASTSPSQGIDGAYGGDAGGGAILNAGTLTLTRSTFSNNGVTTGNGGVGGGGTLQGQPGATGGNGGEGGGGAVCNLGTLWIEASTLSANSVAGGMGGQGGMGGVFVNIGLTGAAGGQGGTAMGGALLNAGTAVLVNSTFVGNNARGGAGGRGGEGGPGLKNGGRGGVGGNGGPGFGGLYSTSGVFFLTNCTVAFNEGRGGSPGEGGMGGTGVPPGQPGDAGTNGVAGGGIRSAGGWVLNTLLATNSPGGNCAGTINDAGNNLSSDSACNFTHPGSMTNTDPKTASLADNGGGTFTMRLLAGSPAVDAGNTASAPLTDQRGYPRPFGAAADIGAYEGVPWMRISRSGSVTIDILGIELTSPSCRLLTSSDFSNWVPVATNEVDPNGTVVFQDACEPGIACRFYRLSVP